MTPRGAPRVIDSIAMMGTMKVSWKTALAALLVVAGVAGVVVLIRVLTGEGLDRAEKWISIVGVCLSSLMSLAGLLLAWQTRAQGHVGPAVSASGPGSVGVGGDAGGAIRTEVSGADAGTPPPAGGPGITASGSGSVAVGGDTAGPITTRVTGPEPRPER
ncbi:hypothetical protein AB0J83_32245 [Actinoplanes sp. NPDC049596]|uniref:hypothetical protein n=1 Tax=unclassified Actinoplanes TaxID=2626549 RepID=UPI00343FF1DB